MFVLFDDVQLKEAGLVASADEQVLLDPTIATGRHPTSRKSSAESTTSGRVTPRESDRSIVTGHITPRKNRAQSGLSTTSSLRARLTIKFDDDYMQVIGSNKSKFLHEGSSKLSLNGARDVEIYDVRPGSIILELRGSREGVSAAVKDLLANNLKLKLSSFRMIKAVDPDVKYLTRGSIGTNLKPGDSAIGTTAITRARQTREIGVPDFNNKEVIASPHKQTSYIYFLEQKIEDDMCIMELVRTPKADADEQDLHVLQKYIQNGVGDTLLHSSSSPSCLNSNALPIKLYV